MTTMKVNIREARERFSEIIHRVNIKGEKVVVMSRNKPRAILVGIDDTGSLADDPVRRARRFRQLEQIRTIRKRLAGEGVKTETLDDLKKLRETRIEDLAGSH
jgi:prevent-host-death family protein